MQGFWNGNRVGEVTVESGGDTTNKDDGIIVLRTRGDGDSSPQDRVTVGSTGQVNFGASTVARVEADGVFKAPHGTEATPAYNFLNDNDNGMFRATTNTIGFSTGGDEKMRINSSGVVCIGTDSPSNSATNLHVENSGENNVYFLGNRSTAGARLILWNKNATANSYTGVLGADSGGQTTAAIKFFSANDSNNEGFLTLETRSSGGTPQERMRIDSEGRFLLAKGTPDTTTSQLQIGNNTTGYSWDVGDTPQVLIAGVNNESPTSGTLNIPLRVSDENANTMFQIHNRGGGNTDVGQVYIPNQLGIRRENPSAPLHIETYDSGQHTLIALSRPTYGTFGEIKSDAGALRITSDKSIYISADDDNDMTAAGSLIIFEIDGQEKARFSNGGGIAFNGDSSSANHLDDYEEGTWSPTIHDNSGNSSTFGTVTHASYTKIGNTVRMSMRAVNVNKTGLTAGDPLYVKGFPFTTTGYNYTNAFIRTWDSANWGAQKSHVFAHFESDKAFFVGDDGGSAGTTLKIEDLVANQTDVFFTVVYHTAQ